MKFSWCQEIFFMNFDFKNGCKNEYKDITKNRTADSEIGFLTKSISKPYDRSTAMPPAWELIREITFRLESVHKYIKIISK